ncbi:trypsin 3A1-like [Schistocerca cancellata]|uniref:trypsin 3A1-like n=1 Tax=Schistocerca cancellata TaxID=274614 RepID=UPI0021183FCC|nr:trypsin 3A1-like [Schistocerca cancellata]
MAAAVAACSAAAAAAARQREPRALASHLAAPCRNRRGSPVPEATRCQAAAVVAAEQAATAAAMATRSYCALAAALLVAMAATSTQSPHGQGSARITDGKAARLGQFPHQALVLGDGTHICGGSLITKTAVLTAAYCTVNFDKFIIRLGTVHRTKNETTAWVIAAHWSVAHPDYDTEAYMSHNVAVVFLPKKAPLSSFIELITLPSFNEVNDTFVGKTALLSGWGKTGDGFGNMCEVLDDMQMMLGSSQNV